MREKDQRITRSKSTLNKEKEVSPNSPNPIEQNKTNGGEEMSEFAQRVMDKFNDLQKAKGKQKGRTKTKNKDFDIASKGKLSLQEVEKLAGFDEDGVGPLDYDDDDVSVLVEANEDDFRESDNEDEGTQCNLQIQDRRVIQEQQAEPSTSTGRRKVNSNLTDENIENVYDMDGDLDSEVQFKTTNAHNLCVVDPGTASGNVNIQAMIQRVVEKQVEQSLSNMLGQGNLSKGTISKNMQPVVGNDQARQGIDINY